MSDENNNSNDGKTPANAPSQTGPRAPLSLKPRATGSVSTGTVKQSFSHGRSKTVVVETKRRAGPQGGHQRPQGFDVARPRPEGGAPRSAGPRQPAGGGRSAEEQEARRRAIALATQQAAERERKAVAAKAAAEAAEREQAAAVEAAAAKAAAEAAAAKAAAEAARVEAAKLSAVAPAPAPAKPAAPKVEAPKAEAPKAEAPKVEAKPEPAKPAAPAAPKRPAVNFGQRAPKIPTGRAPLERPAFGGRSAREQAMGGGERPQTREQAPREGVREGGERPARPAQTVRYSALNPRPAPGARTGAPGAARPGARPAPNQPPAQPEVARPSRAGGGFARPGGREDDRDKRFADNAPGKAVSRTRGEPKRREGRLTIHSVAGGDEDAVERMRSLASVRRAREREKEK